MSSARTLTATAALILATILIPYAPFRAQGATPLSMLTADEIVALLGTASVRAAGDAAPMPVAGMPVAVDADDLMTKVYGVFDTSLPGREIGEAAAAVFGISPENDDSCLWLDSADGFRLSYSGMEPEISAMARFDRDSLSEFGFFFLFPYDRDGRESARLAQAAFCGSLLQEISDRGADMGADASTDALFDASGEYDSNFVVIRLIDDARSGRCPGDGRYILMLGVEPRSFGEADHVAAR